MKSTNNYSLDKLKAEIDRLKTEVDRLNKITNKLEKESESRKKYLAGQACELTTNMRIYEDAIKCRQKFWKELEREKMLDLFERIKI